MLNAEMALSLIHRRCACGKAQQLVEGADDRLDGVLPNSIALV